ncbi:MAG: inositol monophosphatase family protein [Fulvivirga sp.]|nr:inositol monophosphatase family protein [Fulvivirga sp.]
MDLSKILSQANKVVKEAGDFIKKESANFTIEDAELKGFNDLVSYVDKEAEKILVEGCGDILPEAGFIAEEGTSDKKGKSFNWIIDPLDGTTNFTHGLPVYSISVALQQENDIVLGIVYEINRGENFYAIKGEQAKMNGEPIKVSEVDQLNKSLLATGFPYYQFDEMKKYLRVLDDFMQSSHGLRRMGSAAVDLAYVACGRFEGFFEYNLNAWDVAAGAFIVKQAGGQVSDFGGTDHYLFGREIVASGKIHQPMLNIIQKHW